MVWNATQTGITSQLRDSLSGLISWTVFDRGPQYFFPLVWATNNTLHQVDPIKYTASMLKNGHVVFEYFHFSSPVIKSGTKISFMSGEQHFTSAKSTFEFLSLSFYTIFCSFCYRRSIRYKKSLSFLNLPLLNHLPQLLSLETSSIHTNVAPFEGFIKLKKKIKTPANDAYSAEFFARKKYDGDTKSPIF